MLDVKHSAPSAALKNSKSQKGPWSAAAADPATRILIIDQDRQVGVALSFMLAARNFDEVRAVRSADRALAISEQFRPELVFLDIEMPDEQSVMLARSLSRGAQHMRMRLVALTTNLDHPACASARTAGIERFLVKPVGRDELDRILGIQNAAPPT